MKKRISIICALLLPLISLAQDKTQSVSLELFGAHNIVGVNYDTRFKGNTGLGYRVGVGYSYGYRSGLFVDDQTIKGVGIPLEINYLMGKKNHKLEAGFGTSLGIYHVNEEHTYYIFPTPEHPDGDIITSTVDENRFGYFLFGTLGYRYQRPEGFVFRVGISPSFNFGDKHGLDRTLIYPYLGLGWSF